MKFHGKLRYLPNIMRLTFLVLSVLIHTVNTCAQNATKYSNEFLQIGVGARALAMGGSMIASSSDVYSGYWNPAGLVGIKDNAQVSLMHASYFAGIANYDFGAWAAKSGDNGAIGLSLIRFGVDGIANTYDLIRNGEIDYTRVTSFNTTDFAAIISYAQTEDIRSLGKVDFSWGGNMKLISRKVGPFAKAFGFGFDLGFKFVNEKKNWQAGIMLRDVTSTFNSWRYSFTDAQKDVLEATQNVIPKNTLEITLPRIIGGFAKNWEREKWNLLAETNLIITMDGKRNTLVRTNFVSMDLVLGGEVSYSINDDNKLFFRAGLNNFQHYTNKNRKRVAAITPNVGVGITLGKFTIDYALTNLSSVAGSGPSLYSNIFSLKLAINRNSK